MKLIKNERAWRRYVLSHVCGADKWNIDSHKQPTEYPCYVYSVVRSFNYEEEQPAYLYLRDITKMAAAITTAAAQLAKDAA